MTALNPMIRRNANRKQEVVVTAANRAEVLALAALGRAELVRRAAELSANLNDDFAGWQWIDRRAFTAQLATLRAAWRFAA